MPVNLDKYIAEIKSEKDFFNKAKLLDYLKREKEVRIVTLSQKLGVTQSFICHILRLKRIPEMVIDGFYGGQITISHLFIISRLKDPKQIMKVYEKILSNNLTVAQTEEVVRELIYRVKTKGDYLTGEQTQQYIDELKSRFNNVEVKIIQTRIKSKLIIEIKGSLQETTSGVEKIMDKLLMK